MGFCRFQTPKDNKSAPTDDILWLMSDARIIIQEVGEEEDLRPCSAGRLPMQGTSLPLMADPDPFLRDH